MIQHPTTLPKNLLFMAGGVIGLLLLLALPYCGHARSERRAMDAVVEKYNAAMIEFQNSSQALMKDLPLFGAGTGPVELVDKYADELRAIDLSECPEDFRVAFVKYYQSLGSLKTYLEANTGWRGALEGFMNPSAIFSAWACFEKTDNEIGSFG